MSVEQALKTKVTKRPVYKIGDAIFTLSEISKIANINRSTLSARLKNGMSIEEAITKPLAGHNTVGKHTGSLRELAEIYGIKFPTLIARLQRGMSLEEALTKPVKYKTKQTK